MEKLSLCNSRTLNHYDLTIAYGKEADHSGRAVCLLSLERWDRVLESRSRHGCLFVFILRFC
jgi:hypothetical protein